MTIDAHVHFWDYDPVRDSWITDDMAMLRKNYLPGELAGLLHANNIEGCVAVQADQSETETHFLTGLAEKYPFIKGVVGWIDLRNENIDERLDHFSQFPVIKGWRHIVQAEADGFLADKNFRRGVKALAKHHYTYDLLVYHQQLKQALEFVAAFPDQKIIIDHCAKPDVRNKNISEWKMYLKEIAVNQNVYCKLSGLLTEADWKGWTEGDFYPYLDVVFETFGPGRLIFGSDWPVMQLACNYNQWKNLLEQYLENFSEADRKNIFGLNAVAFYNL